MGTPESFGQQQGARRQSGAPGHQFDKKKRIRRRSPRKQEPKRVMWDPLVGYIESDYQRTEPPAEEFTWEQPPTEPPEEIERPVPGRMGHDPNRHGGEGRIPTPGIDLPHGGKNIYGNLVDWINEIFPGGEESPMPSMSPMGAGGPPSAERNQGTRGPLGHDGLDSDGSGWRGPARPGEASNHRKHGYSQRVADIAEREGIPWHHAAARVVNNVIEQGGTREEGERAAMAEPPGEPKGDDVVAMDPRTRRPVTRKEAEEGTGKHKYSQEHLKGMLNKLYGSTDNPEFKGVLDKYDADGSGSLSREEAENMYPEVYELHKDMPKPVRVGSSGRAGRRPPSNIGVGGTSDPVGSAGRAGRRPPSNIGISDQERAVRRAEQSPSGGYAAPDVTPEDFYETEWRPNDPDAQRRAEMAVPQVQKRAVPVGASHAAAVDAVYQEEKDAQNAYYDKLIPDQHGPGSVLWNRRVKENRALHEEGEPGYEKYEGVEFINERDPLSGRPDRSGRSYDKAREAFNRAAGSEGGFFGGPPEPVPAVALEESMSTAEPVAQRAPQQQQQRRRIFRRRR